ncbi:MAG: T9SS type A sorting domain-containing protein [Sphingobacteriales bacterium]|nr:MAG: T9SS type A sorting domain-containing protein [Sphingobacteriales bacterium]
MLSVDREPLSGGGYSWENFQNFSSIKAVSAKNLWYAAGDPSIPGLLQAYKQSCNCDSSSITGDPALVNALGDSSTFDLKPGAQSAADGSGTPSLLPIQVDINNTNRNAYSPVDIGCYAVTPCGTGVFPTIEITNSTADTLQLCGAVPLILTTNVLPGQFTNLQWQKNLVDSIGATANTLSVTSSGSYRLVGTTACGSVASRSVYVSGTIVQPTVTIQSSASSVCRGTSVVFTSTLTNISANPTYQWQVGGINAGSNSNTFTIASLDQSSQVNLIVTSSECAVSVSTPSNTITIAVLPGPDADAGTDTLICSGGAGAQLNGTGGDIYFWSPPVGLSNPNIANPVANPNNTTEYVFTVTNANNCISRDTIVVTVSAVLTPGVSISATSLNVCEGDSVTFNASSTNAGTNPIYQWKVNGINAGTNSPSFTSTSLEDGDRISVDLTSNAPCVSSQPVSSNAVTITVGNLAVPVIAFENNVLSVTNPSAGALYIWEHKAGGVWEIVNPQATGINFIPLVSGEYRVAALEASCIKFSVSLVVDLSAPPVSGIRAYPNPATSTITIGTLDPSDGWEMLSLLDSDGRQVFAPMNILNQTSVTLNISSLQNGVYFVVLRKSSGSPLVIQFVKG